jgi:signal transduction histidine kinase
VEIVTRGTSSVCKGAAAALGSARFVGAVGISTAAAAIRSDDDSGNACAWLSSRYPGLRVLVAVVTHRDLGEEFARETGELTAHRWRIGIGIYLLFAQVGEVVEWRVYPERGLLLVLAYSMMLVVAACGWAALRGAVTHPRSAWVVLSSNVGICLILAVYNAAVHGDLLYVLFTYLAVMMVSSMFVPWGAWFQLALNCGVIAAYVVALAGGARLGPVPAYDYIAIVANTVLSTLGARYIDDYRCQTYAKAAALRDANRRLEEANRARTALLSGLSHDMRTPVSVLTGYADVLGGDPRLPGDLQASVRSIRREAKELVNLVDEILDLARLEAGQLPFQRSTFQLSAVLDPLRETTEDLLRDRGLRLRWNVPATITLDSDASKVRAITRNLLSNAVKFTHAGEIRLQVAAADGGSEIVVSDTGFGIAPEHMERIFDPFRRFDAGSGPQPPGSGFGLYLVKLLIDLLGGRITVHSVLKEGSSFRVWLPPQPPRVG